jgi:hypothetical protein
MRFMASVALIGILASGASAQRGASGHASAGHAFSGAAFSGNGGASFRSAQPSFNLPIGNSLLGGSAHPFSGFRRSAPFGEFTSLPFPFFTDSFDLSDIYSTGYPVASQPPPDFLMQLARSLAGPTDLSRSGAEPVSDGARSSSQPLMIELQNGHYVRVNGTPADGEAREISSGASSTTSSKQTTLSGAGAEIENKSDLASAREMPAVLLIFRDGHSEEVRDYTIADGILYAHGDYYTDGYWNKQIALAALDLPRTLEANASRKVNFVLPSSPNEVIARF